MRNVESLEIHDRRHFVSSSRGSTTYVDGLRDGFCLATRFSLLVLPVKSFRLQIPIRYRVHSAGTSDWLDQLQLHR